MKAKISPTPYPELNQVLAEFVAKRNLDPSWSDLIDGSWDDRPDPAKKVRMPADPVDFERTLKFVKYIQGKSKEYMSEQ